MGAMAMPLAMGGMAAGTTMNVMGQLQQGKDAQKLANARAAADLEAARGARTEAVEKARVMSEEKRSLLSTQRSKFAAAGVLNNVDSPLVIAAKTEADYSKDIGFVLDTGRRQTAAYETSAAYEKAAGKMARKQSQWAAIGSGISGFGSMAYMGYESGMFGKTGSTTGAGSKYGSNTVPASRSWLSPKNPASVNFRGY